MKRHTNPNKCKRLFHAMFFKWLGRQPEVRNERARSYDNRNIRHFGRFGFMQTPGHGPLLVVRNSRNDGWEVHNEYSQKQRRTMPERLDFLNRVVRPKLMESPRWGFRETVLLTACLNWQPEEWKKP